jgi:hypothetical protein
MRISTVPFARIGQLAVAESRLASHRERGALPLPVECFDAGKSVAHRNACRRLLRHRQISSTQLEAVEAKLSGDIVDLERRARQVKRWRRSSP